VQEQSWRGHVAARRCQQRWRAQAAADNRAKPCDAVVPGPGTGENYCAQRCAHALAAAALAQQPAFCMLAQLPRRPPALLPPPLCREISVPAAVQCAACCMPAALKRMRPCIAPSILLHCSDPVYRHAGPTHTQTHSVSFHTNMRSQPPGPASPTGLISAVLSLYPPLFQRIYAYTADALPAHLRNLREFCAPPHTIICHVLLSPGQASVCCCTSQDVVVC
jgi:hypothetical protein